MSKLLKVLMLVVLGLVLGTGTTLFVVWKSASKYADQIAAARAAAAAKKAPDKPWDFWTVELENLVNDLKDERAKVKQQEEDVSQREARLAVEEQELDKTRKQIEAMRAAIDQRLVEVGEGEAANLKKLAQSYSTLTPKAAMAIFRQMDDSTLVKLLSIMKPDIVGSIFEEMSRESVADPALAKRAAVITDKLRLIRMSTNPPSK